jgi:hypothetical protein
MIVMASGTAGTWGNAGGPDHAMGCPIRNWGGRHVTGINARMVQELLCLRADQLRLQPWAGAAHHSCFAGAKNR